uniref:Lebercilin domain-containing protein n=1 Tax=Globisporangium ultimum (strain ATCC 200006 / CBS 805.95 / DAOM BR144) TaxID=431595 RepID=K3WFM8_GLOUD
RGFVATQLEKQHVELRTCKQELRRKAAAVHTTTEKLTKAETEMNHMKNRHAQDMLQWKTKLATMQQKWDADTAKRDREANLKMVDALRDAKAHAGTTMKKNAALEARVLQLEDELKHSKRDADARQRDLIAQMNQVRTLERLLRKCHRTEATLRNDVALLRANAKSASMEERGVYSNEMRRDRDVSQKSRRSNLRQDASLFPLDLLLLPTDSDSGEHLCACDSRSLGRPMRKDVACATEPSRCLKCEDAAEQSEIQRLRLLHSKELN